MWSLLRLVSLRHIFGSPLRSLLTLIGIAVGVATVVGIAAINRSVMEAFRSTIDKVAGKADLTVASEALGFPEELLDTVRAVPGAFQPAPAGVPQRAGRRQKPRGHDQSPSRSRAIHPPPPCDRKGRECASIPRA